LKGRPCRPPRSNAEGPVVLSVRIQPRASRNGITRMEDGSFKIRLTAPPVDGAANEALIEFLSKALDLAKSQVEILSGHMGRDKRVRIGGISEENVLRVLNQTVK
jgi:uncharacterized protein (TIGR00251 family)